VAGESYSDKITQIKTGLHRYFEEVNNIYKKRYSGLPFLVMGHLYIHGVAVSESERDIQIGNQAGIEASIFQGIPDYVALGHIHKPYKVAKESNVHYCGSPISLSFSEKEDIKQVNIVEISKGNVETKIVKVPKFREVLLFEGTLDSVANQLENYTKSRELPALVEVQVTEPMETLNSFEQFQQRIQEFESPDLKVVKSKLQFEKMQQGSGAIVDTFSDLEDLKPLELFQKKLDLDLQLEEKEKEEFTNAFRELLQDLNL
ncbi:MAG: exonuclease sbcCD subunit D, partial [Flavobacteriaceae bacterium]